MHIKSAISIIEIEPHLNAAVGRDIGLNGRLYLFINVSQTFAGGTSLQATLQDSADNVTFADIAGVGGVIPLANLTAGKAFQVGLPIPTRRYTRVNYTVVGTMTAGAVSAHLIDGPIYSFAYPDLL